MFDKWKLSSWKQKTRCYLNNIQESNEYNFEHDYIDADIHHIVNCELLNLYCMFDKMTNCKYVVLYRKIYLYYILPKILELIKICGTVSINDITDLYGIKFETESKPLLKYFSLYKFEIITKSPEIDEELKMQYSKRKQFFWNSYPPSTATLDEQLHGAKLYIPFTSIKYVVIYGVFHENTLLYCNTNRLVRDRLKLSELTPFQKNYSQTLSVKDYLVNDQNLFDIILNNAKKDYERIKTKHINDLTKEVAKLQVLKQRKTIILLLSSVNEEDHLKAKILYDNVKCPFIPLYCKKYLNNAKKFVYEKIKTFDSNQDTNYKEKIVLLKVDDYVKQKAFEKLRDVNSGREISSKAQQYIDGLLKIPFGTYVEEPIFKRFEEIKTITKNERLTHAMLKEKLQNTIDYQLISQFDEEKQTYMQNVRHTLDTCVHGHKEAKVHIERLIGQWIHGKMNGTVFGFQGPPGTGKTTLAKNGFAKCLTDNDGNSRPIAFLPIGGSSGGSFLEGHGYTYMGSTWGKLVDVLMEQKCMNPIIYIDELDKISMSEKGQEINGILIHLTDPSQNKEFNDKYFSGIKFDLSKAIIIFSYNDSSKIDRILRDRITEIHMSPLSRKDKLVITNDYMIPEILDEVGFSKSDVYYDDTIIKFIIDTHTNEAGVRKLKELLYTIMREINIKYLKNEINLPFAITEDFVKNIFLETPKNLYTVIDTEPSIGKVNGLFASTQGTGGITLIEVHNTPSDETLSLVLTGSQGDVMKESMKCAKTLSWNLLSDYEKANIEKTGLHIHCPMGATPKDGPSAGCAITLAIYSRLTKRPVKNDVAMTGEIDLNGKIHAIGGLEAKLFGALRAGVKHVLIPEENRDDYNLFCSKYNDYSAKVTCICHIDEVIQYSLFGEEK